MPDVFPSGQWVRGYLASDTMNTAQFIPLFDEQGAAVCASAADYLKLQGKRLIIDEIIISNGATASKYTVFCDTNGGGTLDAGEELVSMLLAVNTPYSFPNAGNNSLSGRTFGVTGGTNAKNMLMVVASAASVGSSLTLIGRLINS